MCDAPGPHPCRPARYSGPSLCPATAAAASRGRQHKHWAAACERSRRLGSGRLPLRGNSPRLSRGGALPSPARRLAPAPRRFIRTRRQHRRRRAATRRRRATARHRRADARRVLTFGRNKEATLHPYPALGSNGGQFEQIAQSPDIVNINWNKSNRTKCRHISVVCAAAGRGTNSRLPDAEQRHDKAPGNR